MRGLALKYKGKELLRGLALKYKGKELLFAGYIKEPVTGLGFNISILTQDAIFHMGISLPYLTLIFQILAWNNDNEGENYG